MGDINFVVTRICTGHLYIFQANILKVLSECAYINLLPLRTYLLANSSTINERQSSITMPICVPFVPLQLGKFVSVGPTFDKPVAAEFALYRITTFLLASELTNMVWLCWSTDAPPLLIFPFGTLGSFHIYSRLFPEKKLKRSPAHQLENKQVS